MKRTAALAATFAALAFVWTGAAPPLGAAPVVTGRSSPTLEKRAAVPPPDVVERLKKVGLDAKDPGFASKLKALAAQHGSTYVRSHVVSVAPAAIQRNVVKPSFLKTGSASTGSSRLREAGVLAPIQSAIYHDVWDGNHSALNLNTAPVSSPLGYIFLVFTDRTISLSGEGSVSLALGCAGLTLNSNALVLAADGPTFKGTPWFWPTVGPLHPYYVAPFNFPPFAIGQERWGTISVSFDNTTAKADAAFLPTQATVTIDMTIDHSPAVTGFGSVAPWGSTGLTASNATLKDPGTPRIGSGDWATTYQGNDTVGNGVQLGPGWKVTAVTVKSALSAAAPGDTSPDNAWRGAKVMLPPPAGSFQAGVSWHYTGVDTLDYTVEWTLTGPLGQRPLLSMAKHDSCDN